MGIDVVREVSINQGDPLAIYDEEVRFFKALLGNNRISINCLDEEQKLLVLPSSYVGYIKTPLRLININSKHENVTLNHVMRIYFFVHGNSDFLNDSVFDIDYSIDYKKIIDLFINEIENISKIGFPVEYITNMQESKYVKGKVDFTETYKRIKLKNPESFICHYDVLTYETDLNIVLSAALSKVESVAKEKTGKTLISPLLKSISNHNAMNLVDKVIINRKNSYCSNAYIMAKMILKECFLEVSDTSKIGESILINFDDLFEKFIKNILTGWTYDLKFSFWSAPEKYGVYADALKSYHPDILYNYKSGKAHAVIDVKNKSTSVFKNEDIFQVLFYAMMLRSSKIILCYPSSENRSNMCLEIFSDLLSPNEVYAVFINICGEISEEFYSNIKTFTDNIYEVL